MKNKEDYANQFEVRKVIAAEDIPRWKTLEILNDGTAKMTTSSNSFSSTNRIGISFEPIAKGQEGLAYIGDKNIYLNSLTRWQKIKNYFSHVWYAIRGYDCD